MHKLEKWSSQEKLTGTSGTFLAQLKEAEIVFFELRRDNHLHLMCPACGAEPREKLEFAGRGSNTWEAESLTLRKDWTATAGPRFSGYAGSQNLGRAQLPRGETQACVVSDSESFALDYVCGQLRGGNFPPGNLEVLLGI